MTLEWKYSSFSESNTKTIAKLARVGPAKNGELVTEFGRVNNVLLDEVYEDAKKNLSSVCSTSIFMCLAVKNVRLRPD